MCLIGGPDDRGLFPRDLAAIRGSAVRDLVGATSLVELASLCVAFTVFSLIIGFS